MASSLRVSLHERTASTTGTSGNVPLVTPTNHGYIAHEAPALAHAARYPVILVLSLLILHKSFSSAQKWKTAAPREQYRRPAQVPYLTPMLGNAFSFLYAPQELARSISERLGKSGIFSLNMLTQEVYVVSGSEYLNAIWKDTKKGHDVTRCPEPLPEQYVRRTSPARDPDHRVSYLMLKTTADYLSGTHLTATAQKYQAAMKSQVDILPIGDDWVEMDDLFSFTRRLIANSTVETMLGSSFLSQFPDFVDNFYTYNSRIRRFLQGWPKFLLPKAWCARKRCIDIMQQWRKTVNAQDFDGSPMMLKRWSWFEKWNISDDAIAASDLGILWGLLSAATVEMDECRTKEASSSLSFDTTKLTSQPLLQSMHAEALRKYVAVYIPRTTEYGET
ncbi:cytochrome P450 [Physcia stellaris]|nr:cytochrome P450 [Physcia stellaris]